MTTKNSPYFQRTGKFGPKSMRCGYVYGDGSKCVGERFELERFSDGATRVVCNECGMEYTLDEVLNGEEFV